MSFLYILQTFDAIQNNKDVYKVGRTDTGVDSTGTLLRLKGYPKGAVLHKTFPLQRDSLVYERLALYILRIRSSVFTAYGHEYFKDSLDNIIDIVQDVVNSIEHLSSQPTQIHSVEPTVDTTTAIPINETYETIKPFTPEEVTVESKLWTETDDVVERLSSLFISTGNKEDFVTSKKLMELCKHNNIEISSTKLGRTMRGLGHPSSMKKLAGKAGRVFCGIMIDNNHDEEL